MARSNNTTTASTASSVETTKNVRVDGTHVISTIEVRKTRDGKAYTFTVDLDFEGVSDTQVLLWAARTKIIDLQRAIRACDESFIANLAKQGTIRRRAVDAGSGFVDPAKAQQQIINRAASMTPEERAALIKLLSGM